MKPLAYLRQLFWRHVPHRCRFAEVHDAARTRVVGMRCRCGAAFWFPDPACDDCDGTGAEPDWDDQVNPPVRYTMRCRRCAGSGFANVRSTTQSQEEQG